MMPLITFPQPHLGHPAIPSRHSWPQSGHVSGMILAQLSQSGIGSWLRSLRVHLAPSAIRRKDAGRALVFVEVGCQVPVSAPPGMIAPELAVVVVDDYPFSTGQSQPSLQVTSQFLAKAVALRRHHRLNSTDRLPLWMIAGNVHA